MKRLQNQLGFSAFEAIILVLLLAVLGFAGYRAYESRQSTQPEPVVQKVQESPKQTRYIAKEFSVLPPEGWSVKENSEQGITLAVRSPDYEEGRGQGDCDAPGGCFSSWPKAGAEFYVTSSAHYAAGFQNETFISRNQVKKDTDYTANVGLVTVDGNKAIEQLLIYNGMGSRQTRFLVENPNASVEWIIGYRFPLEPRDATLHVRKEKYLSEYGAFVSSFKFEGKDD